VQATFTEKISFVEKTFGKGITSRSGNDIAVSCPICKDTKKKKLSISLTNWSFHCWVCGEKGHTIVPVLRKCFSRETTNLFRQKFLNQKAERETEAEPEEKAFEYPEGFVPLVEVLESRNPNIRSVIAYLRSRDLKDSDFYKYRIGVTPKGRDPRRVFFISLDESGEENYFVSRSIDDKSKQRYVNSTVDKTKIVFNECEIDWDEPVFLVEGIFDQIRLGKNSACLLGSTLSESSLLFRRLVENECNVILALDSDALEKSNRIADSLIKYGCNVSIFPLFDSKDVGSMSREQIERSISCLKLWNGKTSLLSKIGLIKSGSMF
jgi:DNA primase